MNLDLLGKWWQAFAVTVSVLWQTYLAVVKQSGVLIGAHGRLVFVEDADVQSYYISFSPEPEPNAYFDDYGIADDEVFTYLGKWTDLIKHAWQDSDEGWRVTKAVLCYALPLDD